MVSKLILINEKDKKVNIFSMYGYELYGGVENKKGNTTRT